MSTENDFPLTAPPDPASVPETSSPPATLPPSSPTDTDHHDLLHTPILEKPSIHGLGYKDGEYDHKLIQEMKYNYRPTSAAKFMEKFATVKGLAAEDLNLSPSQLETMTHKFKGLLDGKSESAMYAPLCASLNEAVAIAAARRNTQSPPPYTFKDVSQWPESGKEDLKIDIAMYPTTKRAQDAFTRDIPVKDDKPHTARNAWAWMTAGIEVKYNADVSAFGFSESEPLLRVTEDAETRRAQAQLAKYATQIMLRQHRTFVFLIYILRDQARLTRWDRAGCVVSEPINLTKNPEVLLNFVYRLALMSQEELGYDVSAALASKEEIAELEKHSHTNLYARMKAKEILANQDMYPIYKVSVANLNGVGSTTYYIGKYSTASYSPTGRATRGYIAFQEGSSYLCFLKDYWRPNSVHIRPEHVVYRHLASCNVENVAVALGGGDVLGQATFTEQIPENPDQFLQRLHYRVVIKQLARPLEDYRDSAEMIVIVYCALRGHEDAWKKAGVLHRDISDNNIMRVVDQNHEQDGPPKGILIDWDLCKYKSDLKREGSQHGRSGTWKFMSAASLQFPNKPNELADDLESFIHVVTYCGLRFHRHNMTTHNFAEEPSHETLKAHNGRNDSLGQHVWMYYDQSAQEHGFYIGGRQKLNCIQRGSPDFVFSNSVSQHLRTLVAALYRLLQEHYSAIDLGSLKQQYWPDEWMHPSAPAPHPDPELDTPRFAFLDTRKRRRAVVAAPPRALFHPVPQPPATKVLDTHDRIMDLFEDACDAIRDEEVTRGREKANSGPLPPLSSDKTYDQCLGLSSLANVYTKNASGSKRSHSDSQRTSVSTSSRTTKKQRTATSGGEALAQVRE